MKRLIENLSALPKELDIKKARIDINQLVKEALESSKVEQLKSVQVSIDLNDLPSIQGDGEYIKKVLINLVLNAIQSLPGGRGRVELTTYVKDGYAHVEVLDSGAGMTEEFIKNQIFKPFTTTKKKGLGIGLYQCKAIMEAHGGNIEASSIPNRGSQFTLKFPVE
jgi:signal transduction histidine kinase